VSFVGLDGFRHGWVAVRIEGRKRELRFLSAAEEILAWPFARAAIDIPIGLPEDGDRICDVEARKLIAPHRSRVFLGARRWILDCTTLAEANRTARRRGQKGVSAQLFCLRSKIAEIDALVCHAGQDRIRETHPEVVFRRLNGWNPLAPKKTPQGAALRHQLLERDGFRDLGAWLARRIGTGAKPDDILDACACAIAARDDFGKLPADAPRIDARKLRMEIHY
jgi:predicted RNase H-like nuclease